MLGSSPDRPTQASRATAVAHTLCRPSHALRYHGRAATRRRSDTKDVTTLILFKAPSCKEGDDVGQPCQSGVVGTVLIPDAKERFRGFPIRSSALVVVGRGGALSTCWSSCTAQLNWDTRREQLMCSTQAQAASCTPVTSFQVWNRWSRSARYSCALR